MVLYTGDIHGHPNNIIKICKRFNLTRDDIIVILGDVGANYYGGKRDSELKVELAKLKPTIPERNGLIRKKDSAIFIEALMDLPKRMLLLGHDDYDAECKKYHEFLESYKQERRGN